MRTLFWSLIGLGLLLGVQRILADPTAPAGPGAGPVVVSEFVADNVSGLADEDGDRGDWLELHNRSSQAVDLAGWSLSDDPTQPGKWTFRSIALPAGARLVVFASGKDRRSLEDDGSPSYLHTNFRLATEGGFLGLYSPTSRRFLDASVYEYPRQYVDTAFGLADGGATSAEPGYLTVPTPQTPNGAEAGWVGVLEPVGFSAERGLYDAPVTVELSSPDGAEIRYTTDGSEPTAEGGTLYAGPLTVDRTTPLRAAAFRPGYRPAPAVTHSYIFPADVARQPAHPPGWPDTWGVHHITFGGYQEGTPRLADYAMDPEVVGDPQYAAQIDDVLRAIPSLSLVTAPAHLDIYAHPGDRGNAAERPVSAELIDPFGQEPGFQIDAGLRIQGGAGRWEFMPKHSFRLFFKQRYGAGHLEYPLFADSPLTEFDTVTLRAGMDRSFAGHPPAPGQTVDHRLATYTRDEWARASQIAMSGSGSHGRFVHLYLNGLYWGLYNMVERPDTSFLASYFGGKPDDWFAVSQGGAIGGQTDRFDVLLQLAAEGGIADPARYATLLEFIDPIHFSDYVILNWTMGNHDWPENNWYAGVQYPAGPVRFFVWDGETTWDNGADIVLGSDGFEGAPYPNVIKRVFLALMENPEFRTLFADRVHHNLSQGGPLSDERALARWAAINQEIETAIIGESARWGDARDAKPITQADWRRARDLVAEQMTGNAARLLEMLRDAGYYPAVEPPSFSAPAGIFTDTMELTMDTVAGAIYYTLDGSDPRATGGDVAPTAVHYTDPLEMTTATTVKARALHDGQWSALHRAEFARGDQQRQLAVTELMYHPIDGDHYEFVELKNIGDLAIDLSGAYFEGIDFRFPLYETLAPGEFAVLISDFKHFRERYPEAEFHGVYQGKLSDRGETITLRSAAGGVLASVTYNDKGAWPLSPDGTGDSLVLVDPQYPDSPGSWRASADIHGSPGTDEAQVATAGHRR